MMMGMPPFLATSPLPPAAPALPPELRAAIPCFAAAGAALDEPAAPLPLPGGLEEPPLPEDDGGGAVGGGGTDDEPPFRTGT
jgi:hypothetical protein